MNLDSNIVVLIALAQSVLVGFCVTELFRTSGAARLKQSALLSMAISFVLSLVFVEKAQLLVGALMFIAPTGAFTLWNTARVEKAVRRQIEAAPRMVKLAQAYFRSLHVDGVITTATLFDMMEGVRELTELEAEKYEMFNYLIRHMAEIGHVVETRYVYGGGMHGGAVVPVYGISVSDLNTYEARLKEKYAAWY